MKKLNLFLSLLIIGLLANSQSSVRPYAGFLVTQQCNDAYFTTQHTANGTTYRAGNCNKNIVVTDGSNTHVISLVTNSSYQTQVTNLLHDPVDNTLIVAGTYTLGNSYSFIYKIDMPTGNLIWQVDEIDVAIGSIHLYNSYLVISGHHLNPITWAGPLYETFIGFLNRTTGAITYKETYDSNASQRHYEGCRSALVGDDLYVSRIYSAPGGNATGVEQYHLSVTPSINVTAGYNKYYSISGTGFTTSPYFTDITADNGYVEILGSYKGYSSSWIVQTDLNGNVTRSTRIDPTNFDKFIGTEIKREHNKIVVLGSAVFGNSQQTAAVYLNDGHTIVASKVIQDGIEFDWMRSRPRTVEFDGPFKFGFSCYSELTTQGIAPMAVDIDLLSEDVDCMKDFVVERASPAITTYNRVLNFSPNTPYNTWSKGTTISTTTHTNSNCVPNCNVSINNITPSFISCTDRRFDANVANASGTLTYHWYVYKGGILQNQYPNQGSKLNYSFNPADQCENFSICVSIIDYSGNIACTDYLCFGFKFDNCEECTVDDNPGGLFFRTKKKEEIVDNSFEIYPNPANDQLHLELPSSETLTNTVNIYTITGQLVKQINSSLTSIDMNLSDFEEGTYVVELISDQKREHKKLVIVR